MVQLSNNLKIVEQGNTTTLVYTNVDNSTYELKFDKGGMYINNVELSTYVSNIVSGIIATTTTSTTTTSTTSTTTTPEPTTTSTTTTPAPTTTSTTTTTPVPTTSTTTTSTTSTTTAG
jgi:hypothetical protein